MKRILLLLLLALPGFRASSQIIGGEIDYRCLGNGRYEVTVHVDHPCGYPIPTPTILCQVGSGVFFSTDTTLLVSRRALNNTPGVCQTADTCMVDAQRKKILRSSYSTVFDLDTFSLCQTKFFIYESTDPWGGTVSTRDIYYIETNFDRCLAPCDASPLSINTFPPLVPVFEFVAYSAAVYNPLFPDDSFSYQFAPLGIRHPFRAIYNTPHDSVKWITFYGFPNTQLVFPAGMHLDPVTGELRFRPIKNDEKASFLIAVNIHRKINGNWKLIGTKYIENSTEIIAVTDNQNPFISTTSSFAMCHGQRSCVQMTIEDGNLGDSTFVKIYSDSIPDLETTYTRNGRKAGCEVCWTPDSTKAGRQHIFYAELTDNHCPVRGKFVQAAGFTVNRSPEAHRSVSVDPQGMVSLSMTPYQAYPGLLQEWRIYDNSQSSVFSAGGFTATKQLSSGRYFVHLKMISQQCFTRYTDTVDVVLSSLENTGAPIRLYPNPFTQSLFLEMADVVGLQLFNSLGQSVAVGLEGDGGLWEITPLNGTKPGVYWLRIETPEGVIVQKVVKE